VSRADLRLVLDGVIYRMRSGVQWNRLPRRFGPDSTVHGWFQRFVADGVLVEIWAAVAGECDELGAVLWEWQAADGVMGKSRFDGEARGPNPTDRAKMGTKKHLLVEQDGGPLGLVVAGANVNDHKLLEPTIEAIVIERPDPEEVVQHLCLDPPRSPLGGRAHDRLAAEVPGDPDPLRQEVRELRGPGPARLRAALVAAA
jgi:putative transposase